MQQVNTLAIMFPCSPSTCLQGVVALGLIGYSLSNCLTQFSSYLPYSLILKLFIHKFKFGLCGPLATVSVCESLTDTLIHFEV